MTNEEARELSRIRDDTIQWLLDLVWREGFWTGVSTERNPDNRYSLIPKDWERLSGGWGLGYGCIDYVINETRPHSWRAIPGWGQSKSLRVFGRNNNASDRFVVLVAEMIETIMARYLEGITQRSFLRICSSGICDLSQTGHYDICRKVGRQFVCDECLGRFSLPQAVITPKPQREKGERDKMSVSLRFDVLARDGFRCAACGRRPAKDNSIELDIRRLHIDHIMPVARQGKTEWGNLVTLCQDCNLGKSDKVLTEELRDYLQSLTA